jgi:hypothetical protein
LTKTEGTTLSTRKERWPEVNEAGAPTSAGFIDWLPVARKSWDAFSPSAEQSPLRASDFQHFFGISRLGYFNINLSALFRPKKGLGIYRHGPGTRDREKAQIF